ncbi:MAG: ABC transporter substrate-binding protein, partial [Pseudomonadota bacterium]
MERRTLLKATAASVAALSAPGLIKAQTSTYTMSSWLKPGAMTENFFDVWREDIASLTNGRVTIEVLPKPLGPPPAHLGILEENRADFAYSLHGYSKDRFLRARVGQFSFLGDAYSVSQAFSKIYREALDAPQEHQGMELLALFQHGPGVLMLKDKKIKSSSDFAGLRIRTSGGYIGSLLEDLGAINKPMS